MSGRPTHYDWRPRLVARSVSSVARSRDLEDRRPCPDDLRASLPAEGRRCHQTGIFVILVNVSNRKKKKKKRKLLFFLLVLEDIKYSIQTDRCNISFISETNEILCVEKGNYLLRNFIDHMYGTEEYIYSNQNMYMYVYMSTNILCYLYMSCYCRFVYGKTNFLCCCCYFSSTSWYFRGPSSVFQCKRSLKREGTRSVSRLMIYAGPRTFSSFRRFLTQSSVRKQNKESDPNLVLSVHSVTQIFLFGSPSKLSNREHHRRPLSSLDLPLPLSVTGPLLRYW